MTDRKPTELTDDDLNETAGGLRYKLDRAFIKSWSTSGDADDRPTSDTVPVEDFSLNFEQIK